MNVQRFDQVGYALIFVQLLGMYTMGHVQIHIYDISEGSALNSTKLRLDI